MKYDAEYVAGMVHDLVTEVDPYASSKEYGDAFIARVLNLLGAARQLEQKEMTPLFEQVRKTYKNY